MTRLRIIAEYDLSTCSGGSPGREYFDRMVSTFIPIAAPIHGVPGTLVYLATEECEVGQIRPVDFSDMGNADICVGRNRTEFEP